VLYELSTGQDRCEFPDLPTGLGEMQDPDQFRELNQVILKACEDDPHKRYRKAEEMHGDLLLLMAGKSVRRIRVLERRIAQFKKAGLAAALMLLVAASTLFGWNRHLRKLEEQRQQELRREAEQKQQQIGRNVVHGNNLVDAGDFFGALPYFWEALSLEENMAPGGKNNRLRIGALLEQCPRIAKLWILPHQYLNAADLSPDGQYVITAGKDGTAMLCDITAGSKNLWSKETDELEAVSFSPDGRYVAAAGYGFVKVWDFSTHTLISTASHPRAVYSVKFTPDGSQFVTASGWDNEGHICL